MLPRFHRNLKTWRGTEREIGLGSIRETRKILAVDLRTGDSLWQHDCEPGSCLSVAGREAFYSATRDRKDILWRLSALDPASGTVKRIFPLPIRILRSMHVFGPRSDRTVLVGDNTLALSLADGRILWQMPYEAMSSESHEAVPAGKDPQYLPYEVFKPRPPPRAEWRDGRLFLIDIGPLGAGGFIREVNLETGRHLGAFELPAGWQADYSRMHLLAGPGNRGVTVIPEPNSGNPIALRYEGHGSKPGRFFAGTRVIAAGGRVAVSYSDLGSSGFRMAGYAAFGPGRIDSAGH